MPDQFEYYSGPSLFRVDTENGKTYVAANTGHHFEWKEIEEPTDSVIDIPKFQILPGNN